MLTNRSEAGRERDNLQKRASMRTRLFYFAIMIAFVLKVCSNNGNFKK